jgi:hypothetical protein
MIFTSTSDPIFLGTIGILLGTIGILLVLIVYNSFIVFRVANSPPLYTSQTISEEDERQLLRNFLNFHSATIICPITLEPSSEEAQKKLVEQRQLLTNVLKFNSVTIICPITMEPITSPTILECGHVFESESARGCLNAEGHGARCPICRAPFKIVE